MKKFYDVNLKITAREREDYTELVKIEENTDCVVFDSKTLKIMTYDRVRGDIYVPSHCYEFPRGNIYAIEIEFRP